MSLKFQMNNDFFSNQTKNKITDDNSKWGYSDPKLSIFDTIDNNNKVFIRKNIAYYFDNITEDDFIFLNKFQNEYDKKIKHSITEKKESKINNETITQDYFSDILDQSLKQKTKETYAIYESTLSIDEFKEKIKLQDTNKISAENQVRNINKKIRQIKELQKKNKVNIIQQEKIDNLPFLEIKLMKLQVNLIIDN